MSSTALLFLKSVFGEGAIARTHGHGNPNWTRDETILALELYFVADGGRLRSRDERVDELSRLLRSLPYHEEAARQATFRNPAGVAFKVQNLRQIATGSGLGNVSETDRTIWAEFGSRPDEVARLAALIRTGIALGRQLPDLVDYEEEFYEGRLLTRQHFVRERNARIRNRLLAVRSAAGLRCDICEATHDHLPTSLRDAAFEGHHVVPISEVGERPTRLADMALLCATCHRLLHRAISQKGAWLSVADARHLFAPR